MKLRLQVPGLGSDASPAVQERGHASATGLDGGRALPAPALCRVQWALRPENPALPAFQTHLLWGRSLRCRGRLLSSGGRSQEAPKSLVSYLGLCPH